MLCNVIYLVSRWATQVVSLRKPEKGETKEEMNGQW